MPKLGDLVTDWLHREICAAEIVEKDGAITFKVDSQFCFTMDPSRTTLFMKGVLEDEISFMGEEACLGGWNKNDVIKATDPNFFVWLTYYLGSSVRVLSMGGLNPNMIIRSHQKLEEFIDYCKEQEMAKAKASGPPEASEPSSQLV